MWKGIEVGRSQLTLREVTLSDVPQLAELWSEISPRRGHEGDMLAEMASIVERALGAPEDRIVVAECGGEFAGAVYLRIGEVSPLHPDRVVQVHSPHVTPRFRHLGVGRALVEAGVAHAEEHGIGHVASASLSTSREAHRFLARLAFAPQAVLRLAPTHVVRAKLTAQKPATTAGRNLGQVLAARRTLRRQRDLV